MGRPRRNFERSEAVLPLSVKQITARAPTSAAVWQAATATAWATERSFAGAGGGGNSEFSALSAIEAIISTDATG
jgi:hypothetical protein